MEFCAAVCTRRVCRFFFVTRGVALVASEDIVGGDVYERRSIVMAGVGDILNRLSIYQFRQSLLLFSLLHVGVGGAVHHHVNLVLIHEASHRLNIGDVEFINIGEDIAVAAISRHNPHLSAKLSVRSCYKNPHFSNTKGETKSLISP